MSKNFSSSYANATEDTVKFMDSNHIVALNTRTSI